MTTRCALARSVLDQKWARARRLHAQTEPSQFGVPNEHVTIGLGLGGANNALCDFRHDRPRGKHGGSKVKQSTAIPYLDPCFLKMQI
jgi:hypothetical protein